MGSKLSLFRYRQLLYLLFTPPLGFLLRLTGESLSTIQIHRGRQGFPRVNQDTPLPISMPGIDQNTKLQGASIARHRLPGHQQISSGHSSSTVNLTPLFQVNGEQNVQKVGHSGSSNIVGRSISQAPYSASPTQSQSLPPANSSFSYNNTEHFNSPIGPNINLKMPPSRVNRVPGHLQRSESELSGLISLSPPASPASLGSHSPMMRGASFHSSNNQQSSPFLGASSPFLGGYTNGFSQNHGSPTRHSSAVHLQRAKSSPSSNKLLASTHNATIGTSHRSGAPSQHEIF